MDFAKVMEDPFKFAKQKIMNAPVIEYPYPHILIDEIFPKWFYDELIKNIPGIKEYTAKPKYPGRKTLTLDNFDNLEEEKRSFWEKMDAIQGMWNREKNSILQTKAHFGLRFFLCEIYLSYTSTERWHVSLSK